VSAVENLGGGNFRIVGTYKNADYATAPVEVNGFLFEGTTADLASPANYRTVDYPGARFNFPKSISGGLIISNYDSAADHGTFGLPYGPGHASIYDIASDTFLTDINFPGALSNTAYGIVHNGGTSYTIAGGYSLDGTNNFDDQGRPIGTPFLVDYDTSTGLFTHWTSLSGPSTTVRQAHLTGLSRLDSNTYTFSAISAPVGDPVDKGSYGFVRRNNDGSFGTPTWVELQVDGYDPDTNVTTVAAVSGNHVLGVVAATGGGGVNPFQATITTTYPTSNIISGNGQHGILLENADNGRISGNFIGTDVTGLIDRGNLGNGILITSASTGNLIGGQEPFGNDPTGNVFVRPPQGNVISGNELNGVFITGKSTQNILSGNFIGTDVTGLADLGNELDGVAIVKAANNSLIGATLTTQSFAFYNIVSGNNRNGLRIAGSKNTLVQGNYFGHAADASSTVGNTLHGILIDAKSTGSLIGGASPLDNDVSGNGLN
jgi:hypothetical protein